MKTLLAASAGDRVSASLASQPHAPERRAEPGARRSPLCAPIAAVAAVVAGLAALMIGDLLVSFREQKAVVAKEAENLSAVIEGNVLATVAKIDVVLAETVHTLAPSLAEGRSLDVRATNRDLLRRMAYIPEAQEGSLRVVNAEGRVIYNAGETADLPSVSVADRAYFLRVKADPEVGLVVSEPLLSRFTGKWLIVLCRRIGGPDGRFLGEVQTALRTEYFASLFDVVRLGPSDLLSVWSLDMQLLARWPAAPNQVGRAFTRPQMSAGLAAGEAVGSYQTVSPIDGVERLFVYRKLAGIPYVLNIGRDPEAFLSSWRYKAAVYALSFVGVAAALIAVVVVAVGRQREAERLAAVDQLTGLGNRRTFDALLEARLPQRRAGETQHVLLLLDVDHFKAINDLHGHLKGDEVLRRVAGVLRRSLRTADRPCRWGGEEFIALLSGCDLDRAREIAEMVRRAVGEEPLAEPDDGVRVTVSCGLAEIRPGDTADAAITRADAALYRAKQDGRNRTCVA